MKPHSLGWIVLPLSALAVVAFTIHRRRSRRFQRSGYAALIGNTPLVELKTLSKLTKRRIFVKAEYLNPGGTGKDRIALSMLETAEAKGLRKGGTVVEGTSGSTGIALAALCACKGYRCVIVMPDDQAPEKKELLSQFGAEVHMVRTAAISNPNHYVNVAKQKAKELKAVFTDQFENVANFEAHYTTTGPEIWSQSKRSIDAFIMSAGTGGTIAGVSRYLKQVKPGVRVVLADPPGSSLFHYVKHGVCWTPQQAERGIKRHRYDTIAEGIGLDRLTKNLLEASIDDSVHITDQQALEVAHFVLRKEGLFIGSSSAVNIAATLKYAKHLPEGSTIVTVVCDSGQRHRNRFWNESYVTQPPYSLTWPTWEQVQKSVSDLIKND